MDFFQENSIPIIMSNSWTNTSNWLRTCCRRIVRARSIGLLRHPDLNPNNILICPDSGAISSIIDWQHTTIEPRLLVAGYPRAFENPDTEERPNLKEPSLPADYETLSGEAKMEADELHRRRLLLRYYHLFNGGLNKAHISALRDPLLYPRQHL